DNRNLEHAPGPPQRVGVQSLTGQEEGAKGRAIVFPDELALWVLAFDRAESGRRGEETDDLVLRNNAPEGAGVGCPNRLAFEEYGRVAVGQRRIDHVRVFD